MTFDTVKKILKYTAITISTLIILYGLVFFGAMAYIYLLMKYPIVDRICDWHQFSWCWVPPAQ